MAIIKCPECGHQVSEKAPTCPSCGVRIVGNIIRCQECGQVYFKDEALCPVCHNPSPVMNRPVNMGAQPAVPQEGRHAVRERRGHHPGSREHRKRPHASRHQGLAGPHRRHQDSRGQDRA